MSNTTSNSTAQATNTATKGRKIRLGSVKQTSNPKFASGPVRGPAEKNGVTYANEAEILSLLPAPSEGHRWTIKLFRKDNSEWSDIIFQEEPIYNG